MTGCTTCDLGLAHCHAPLIEHADGTAECAEGCGGPRAVHDAVLGCDDHCCADATLAATPAPLRLPARAA